MLLGMPDLQQPLRVQGTEIHYAYGLGTEHFVLADSLEIDARADGSPDFALQFVRTADHTHAAYGVLDFKIRPNFPVEAALSTIRERDPQATITRLLFSQGVIRYHIVGDGTTGEWSAPTILNWNELGIARFILKLSADDTVLMERALKDELLTVQVNAELEYNGIAPRLPYKVKFNPASVLKSLLEPSPGSTGGLIARESLCDWIRKNLDAFTVQDVVLADVFLRDPLKSEDFTQTIADHIRMQYGQFSPAPEVSDQVWFRLNTPDPIADQIVEWDLSEPLSVSRMVVLQLEPITSARKLLRDAPLSSLIQYADIPALKIGSFNVDVAANLPDFRPAVLAIGAELYIAPRMPYRMQAVSRSLEFNPPADRMSVSVQLAPKEKLEYTLSPFVILDNGGRIVRFDGQPMTFTGEQVWLNVGQFPMRCVIWEVSSNLLKQAQIQLTLHWQDGDQPVEQTSDLMSSQRRIAFVTPQTIIDATVTVVAKSLDGLSSITLGPLPLKSFYLDTVSFPEYGPHTVEIECQFENETSLYGIDVIPDSRSETPENIQFLFFTPENPKRRWSWFAESLFQPAFRYRPHVDPDSAPAEWIHAQSAFNSLVIQTIPKDITTNG